jgi:hypothetical protein
MNKWQTISELVKQSGLNIMSIVPSYYTIPRIGANPKFVKTSTKYIFPCMDSILKKMNNLELAKVVYFIAKK